MEKITDIIDSIAHEKGLKTENVTEALKAAFIKTAKNVIDAESEYEAEVNEETKSMQLFQIITIVEDDDERLNAEDENQNVISLSEAKELDDEVEPGDTLRYEQSLEDHGRTAAQSLYREMEYHIQRVVEDQLYKKYNDQIGKIVSGRVVRVDGEQNTFMEIEEVRAILPMKSRIKGEIFAVGDIMRAIVRRVRVDKANGLMIELSRTSPKFLEELLSSEVPEINDGLVTIEASARIPGERAKIALLSNNPKIDPVGATVGVKGVRINAVSSEIINENIDCIEYTPIMELLIARSLSPAIVTSVTVEGEKAVVTPPADQKSKAIGKSGINIRLASMLTGLQIELVETDSKSDDSETIKKKEEKESGVDSLKALFGE